MEPLPARLSLRMRRSGFKNPQRPALGIAEFWFCAAYVAQGAFRGELLYAAYHMEAVVRAQLLTMLSWYVGTKRGAL